MTAPPAYARRTGSVIVPLALFPDLPRTAYAATVEGNGQAPRLCEGDVVVVDPERSLAAGDVVVVWPIDGTTRAELRRLGAVHVVIGVLAPGEVRKIEPAPAR